MLRLVPSDSYSYTMLRLAPSDSYTMLRLVPSDSYTMLRLAAAGIWGLPILMNAIQCVCKGLTLDRAVPLAKKTCMITI